MALKGNARYLVYIPPGCGRYAGSAEEHRRFLVAILGHGVEPAHRLRDRHGRDVRAAEGDHLAPLALAGEVEHGHTETGREHAVEAGGGAAALDVAQRRGARLDARRLLDGGRECLADTAEAGSAEGVKTALGVRVIHPVEHEALRDDDEGGATAVVRARDPLGDLFHGGALLGNENRV